MIYFDYAATSIKHKKVLQKLIEEAADYDGNPESLHRYGRKAHKLLEGARENLANILGVEPKMLYFTSGGSEANSTVIQTFRHRRVLSSQIEHPSVLNALKMSAVQYIATRSDGGIDLFDLKKNGRKAFDLVTVMAANNETGVVQPIGEVRDLIGDKVHLHVDAVQTLGHTDVKTILNYADTASFSGHKVGGLRGFGVLFSRKKLPPLIYGGEQEQGRRGGTSFVMGAVSMVEACLLTQEAAPSVSTLKPYLLARLKEERIPFECNGTAQALPHIVNLSFPFAYTDFLLTYLDMNGIAVSAGSACSAGTMRPSHTVVAMKGASAARHAVRISFGFGNTKEEVDVLVRCLTQLYQKEREKNA